MSNRLDAIRQRLKDWRDNCAEEGGDSDMVAIFEAHAADDMAHLLAEIDTLRQRAETAEQERDEAREIVDAFDAGQEAAGLGKQRENPYPSGDSWGVPLPHQLWEDGYDLMTVKAIRAERDAALQRVTALEAERDTLRAQLATGAHER